MSELAIVHVRRALDGIVFDVEPRVVHVEELAAVYRSEEIAPGKIINWEVEPA